MSGDLTNAISFEPGAGQPQEKTPAEQAPNEVQPQYITRDEALKMANEAAEAAWRRAQGYIDKGQSRVQGRLVELTKHLDMMKAANVQVTPEQERYLRQQALEEAFQPESPAPAASPGAQPGPQPATPPPDPITAEAWRMMQTAGITLEDSDPETGSLDQNHGPYAFLRSVEKAIDTKRQRLGQAAPSTQPPAAPAPARAPTNAGGIGASTDPILSNNDPDDLIARGLGLK